MLIQDIRKRNSLEKIIWMIEKDLSDTLQKFGARKVKIEIKQDLAFLYRHSYQPSWNGLCECTDCVGDFSGASFDDWGGR